MKYGIMAGKRRKSYCSIWMKVAVFQPTVSGPNVNHRLSISFQCHIHIKTNSYPSELSGNALLQFAD